MMPTAAPGSVDGMPPRPPGRPALKFLAVVAVATVVVIVADAREVLDAVRRLPGRTIAIAVLVLSADRVMMGVKWRHLVQGAGSRMRLADAVSIYYQSKFTTLVFPAAFGGEVLRGVLGTRAGVPGGLLIASMVAERVVAAVSALLLAALGFMFLGDLASLDRQSGRAVVMVAAAASTLAVTALMALHRPSHRMVGRAVRRWIPARFFLFMDRLSIAVVDYGHVPGVLVANLGLTIIEQLLQIVALAVLANGLGVRLSPLQFLAATSIVMLVRRGAGFLEGWGIAETGVVMLYTLFGVPSSRSAALALTLWAVSVVACLPGGYLLWRDVWRSRRPRLSGT